MRSEMTKLAPGGAPRCASASRSWTTVSIGSNWMRSAYRMGSSSALGVRARVLSNGVAREGEP